MHCILLPQQRACICVRGIRNVLQPWFYNLSIYTVSSPSQQELWEKNALYSLRCFVLFCFVNILPTVEDSGSHVISFLSGLAHIFIHVCVLWLQFQSWLFYVYSLCVHLSGYFSGFSAEPYWHMHHIVWPLYGNIFSCRIEEASARWHEKKLFKVFTVPQMRQSLTFLFVSRILHSKVSVF